LHQDFSGSPGLEMPFQFEEQPSQQMTFGRIWRYWASNASFPLQLVSLALPFEPSQAPSV
jgi:hypothetical protein